MLAYASIWPRRFPPLYVSPPITAQPIATVFVYTRNGRRVRQTPVSKRKVFTSTALVFPNRKICTPIFLVGKATAIISDPEDFFLTAVYTLGKKLRYSMRQRIGRVYLRMPLNPEAERVSRKLYHLRNTVLRHCGYRPIARVGDRLMMIAVYGYTFARGRKNGMQSSQVKNPAEAA